MKVVEFHPGAAAEAVEAQLWYELKRPGLGETFASAVEGAVQVISELPGVGPQDETGVQRYVLARFPYVIAYVVLNDVVVVLAVAHTRRRPGYWHHRLRTFRRS